MLRSLKELHNYVLAAEDGEIGRCKDFIFDDSTWTIRYMVADTGKWLPKRKVLISPASLGDADWRSQRLQVLLSRKDIENAPSLDTDAPISREYEREWYKYYNWSPYWYGDGIWGSGVLPRALGTKVEERSSTSTATAEHLESPHHNLRSAEEVRGYNIQAADDRVGHVEDFIVDDETWTIRYVVVDTRNWLPGKKVLVAPTWAEKIDWTDGLVHVDLTKKLIKGGPEYDPQAAVNREYEARLYDYYGRPKYWGE